MKLVIRAAMLWSVIVGGVHAGEMREIHGRVIDEIGMPVAGADVSFFWTANGPLKDRNGKQYELESVEGRKVFSANLGKMFPLGDVERPTRTGPDGRFSISVPGDRHHLLAMDHPRKSRRIDDIGQRNGNERRRDPSWPLGACQRLDRRSWSRRTSSMG